MKGTHVYSESLTFDSKSHIEPSLPCIINSRLAKKTSIILGNHTLPQPTRTESPSLHLLQAHIPCPKVTNELHSYHAYNPIENSEVTAPDIRDIKSAQLCSPRGRQGFAYGRKKISIQYILVGLFFLPDLIRADPLIALVLDTYGYGQM